MSTLDFLRGFFVDGVAYPHQLAFLLDIRLRRLSHTPEEIADRLHLAPDARILEIGPGSGYFSLELSRRVPAGHLELFDIQPEMLDKVRAKLERAGRTNVGYTCGNAGEPLPYEAEFDVLFVAAVLGEIPDPAGFLRDGIRVVVPGGLLSVTEHRLDPDFHSLGAVRRMAEEAGFVYEEQHGRPWNYTANFRKPG